VICRIVVAPGVGSSRTSDSSRAATSVRGGDAEVTILHFSSCKRNANAHLSRESEGAGASRDGSPSYLTAPVTIAERYPKRPMVTTGSCSAPKETSRERITRRSFTLHETPAERDVS
jgi:hypothetical protein